MIIQFLFSDAQDDSLDIEGHGPAEVIPTLLEDRGKAGLSRPVTFFGNPEILLDLVPNFRDFLIPFDFILCKGRVNLVLPHDSVTHAVHVQEVAVGLAAISFVGVNIWRKFLPMKAVGHHVRAMLCIIIGGFGNRGG